MSIAKNPARPPGKLSITPDDIRKTRAELARITFATSPYALPWGRGRSYGPLARCRWDPHPVPPGEHPGETVLYAAADLLTCVAEVFASTRCIDPHSNTPVLQVWEPTRTLRLLDLTSHWALRNGASVSLDSAPRSTCRAWAQAIRAAAPELDGLVTRSTMTGGENTVLFTPATDSIPPQPRDSAPLSDPTIYALLLVLAPTIGYQVI